MPVFSPKMPSPETLSQDVADGLTADQIGLRYNVTREHVARRLKDLGITAMIVKRRPEPDGRRIVVERRVTAAENGGTTYMHISLPRIGMHDAYRENPNGLSR